MTSALLLRLPEFSATFRAFLLAACVLLTACAGLDPHGVVSRHLLHAGEPDAPLDLAGREEAFDFVWQRIRDAYIDPALRGLDWQGVAERYRPRALAAKDDHAFWRELDLMSAELADAHTRVESPQAFREIREQAGVSLGVLLREIAGELYVERLSVGSEAWLLGLRPGAKILSIAGQPALAWWQAHVAAARAGSSPWNRQRLASQAFNTGKAGERVALEFARADGQHARVQLERRIFSSQSGVRSMRLASGLGYVRFSDFNEFIRSDVLAALEELREAKGLILDLRDNPGGSIYFARALAGQFVAGEQTVAKLQTRSGRPVSLLFGLIDLIPADFTLHGADEPLRQPLVILTNQGTASAAELLAASLHSLGRARLIGERSCGCVLGYLGYTRVPGGGALAYSEFGFQFSDGRQIEGRGLLPDEAVPVTPADLASGRDAALEAALVWLQAQD